MSAAGKGPSKQSNASAGTGAALGTELLRYSGIHAVGVVASNLLTFAAVILVANFIDPIEFGSFGLLLFLAGLMTLLFTLGSKQGTLKRTFGGDDDEEDDEEEDELAASPPRSLGTGLVLIALVSTLGTLLTVLLAAPIGDVLIGEGTDQRLIVWAAIAGGTGALYRVASIAIWLERRPVPYIKVEVSRPIFTVIVLVPLLLGGAGLEGAIAATAIGSAFATLFSLVLLRGSWELCFDRREAIAIYRKGAIRIPLVLSMWTVGYADVFLLSRYVGGAELGTYVLASKAGFLVAFLPGGYRKALRPLQKTSMFSAVESEYGVGTTRGIQFAYFVLTLCFVMLSVTVLANVLVRVAPSSYADAAPLIPLLSAGLIAPTVYRMLNKSVKYANKRVPFIAGAVVAALTFIGLALVLIPAIGVEGAPLAMIGAFIPPTLFIFWRSQRGRSPIVLPWRPILTAIALTLGIGLLHAQLTTSGVIVEILSGILAIGLWIALIALTGAVPSYHRGAIVEMVRSLGGRGRDTFDPKRGLDGLSGRERLALRRAIVRGRSPEQAVRVLTGKGGGGRGGRGGGSGGGGGAAKPPDPAALLVRLLRKAAIAGGAPGLQGGYGKGTRRRRDRLIGEYLFAEGSIATRDQLGKRLLNDGSAEAFDLHTLEAVVASLKRVPQSDWKRGGGR